MDVVLFAAPSRGRVRLVVDGQRPLTDGRAEWKQSQAERAQAQVRARCVGEGAKTVNDSVGAELRRCVNSNRVSRVWACRERCGNLLP